MQRKGIGRRYVVTQTYGSAAPNGSTTYAVLARGVASKPTKLVSMRICRTDATPADETLVIVRVFRGLGPNVGTSYTPVPVNSTDSASAFTAFTAATGTNTGGTVMFEDAWNTRVPYDIQFAPDEAIQIDSSNNNWVIYIASVAVITINLKYTLVFEENN